MAPRRAKLVIASALLGLAAGGYWLVSVMAAQGQGTLAQSPLNVGVVVKPAFMMAVDDSGSMTFQAQFPGADGEACFNDTTKSFFDAAGKLNTTGSCDYFYVLKGPRVNSYPGIPQIDTLGFARSSDFNPSFFNPANTYLPWQNSDGTPYADASTSATDIDPRGGQGTLAIATTGYYESTTIRNGMVIPAGVTYTWSGSASTVPAGGLTWNKGTGSISIKYYPATFYLKYTADSDPLPAGYAAAERAKVSNACGSGCTMWRYQIASANTVAMQNFANWLSFYGNRNRAMVAGMTRSLSQVTNMRVGYFTINSYASYDAPTATTEKVTMYDMATGSEKSSLFTKLIALPASGGTPNLNAVNAASKQFTRTDSAAPVLRTCQRNAVMLFTDGYSNGSGPSPGNTDGTMTIPFKDSNSDTLADIVTQYYLDASGGTSPLRTDLDKGKVPIPDACSKTPLDPKLDCQRNLHLNFYGITLGAKGTLFNPVSTTQDPYTDASIYNNWPKYLPDTPNTVDDIWHATLNTRGEYINAKTPDDIYNAMRRVLGSFGEAKTPSGSISLTGARLGGNSLSVVPDYQAANSGTDWFGHLTASTAVNNAGVLQLSTVWEASAKLATNTNRKISFGSSSTSGVAPTVKDFTAANLGADSNAQLTKLCSDALATAVCTNRVKTIATATEAVGYLRGARTLEIPATGTVPSSAKFRTRTTLLGDIINSNPVISSKGDDYGYRSLRSGTTADPYGYGTFLKSKFDAGNPPVVFVGANDGMLHAFSGADGVETFAYIPASSVGHMGNLLFPYKADDKNDQGFQHRYFVDGPNAVSDAYINSAWKTVLVGSSGAGGRDIFALDITTAGSLSVLWEVNDQVSDANGGKDIGNVLGKPIVVPVKVGTTVKWKAIFGNGYGSANKKAVLFMVDLDDGKVTRITAEETGSGAPSTPNGLGNVMALDRWVGSGKGAGQAAGRDGFADTVYAADLNGAVWKFDLRDNSLALGANTPLFVAKDSAGNRQPILGGLEAANAGGGVMIYFGSGSFSFDGDQDDKAIQTVYGVLDSEKYDSTAVVAGRTELHQQSITTTTAAQRIVTGSRLAAGDRGWYLDLVAPKTDGTANPTGERAVGYPRLQNGILFFPTYDPDSSDPCAITGNNWLYGLDAISGASALQAASVGSATGGKYSTGTGAVKLQTDGGSPMTAPVKDVGVYATPKSPPLASGATPADLDKALANQCSIIVQAPGSAPLYLPRPCGRQSWRQIR